MRKLLFYVGMALELMGCASSSVDHIDLPAPLHADAIFLGRIVEAADTMILLGDLPVDATWYQFEVVGQPGTRFQGVGLQVRCTKEEVGDGALLVFAQRETAKDGSRGQFVVWACPRVDSDVVARILDMDSRRSGQD